MTVPLQEHHLQEGFHEFQNFLVWGGFVTDVTRCPVISSTNDKDRENAVCTLIAPISKEWDAVRNLIAHE